MNILAERSFPTFFKDYAPKLLKFYSDWLDWTEAPGNAQYILNHLSTEQDIDESVDSYRNHLKAKLLPEFPERVSVDLKLLLKNVLWLYRAKSSRKAYDFLFQVLFNSPATIWHPRETMLRTSDGYWDAPHYFGIVEEEIGGEQINNDWLIQNCLGWRMTGQKSRTEAFIAAATSSYAGTIECLASDMPKLARVAFYWNYGTTRQRLLKSLGTIECDPTLTAFRITNPNRLSTATAPFYTIEDGGVPKLAVLINGQEHDVLLEGFGTNVLVGTANGAETFSVSIDENGRLTFNLSDAGPLFLAGSNLEDIEDIKDVQTIPGLKARFTRTYESNETSYAEQKLTLKAFAGNPKIIVEDLSAKEASIGLPPYEAQTTLEVVETAVWTLNKKKMTQVLVAGTEMVDIGTRSFPEPTAKAVGSFEQYDVVNLEAYIPPTAAAKGEWVPVTIEKSDRMLIGKLVTKIAGYSGRTAFTIAVETVQRATSENESTSQNVVSFNQYFQLRKRNGSSFEKNLASFYLQVNKLINYGNVINTVTKSCTLTLESENISTCRLVGYNRIKKSEVYAYSGEAGQIIPEEWIDWSDLAEDEIVDTFYEFEKPISNVVLSLEYDFDRKKYVVSSKSKLSNDLVVSCRIGQQNASVLLPAGSKEAEVEITLPNQLVSIDSRNVFGVQLDNPTAHFAPGEKVRLLDPNTGETAFVLDSETGERISVEPTIYWHAESEGHYTSTKGFLSDINAIQDNHYWQTFSYVVQSDVGIAEWRRIVKTLLHPAGLEIFGEVMLEGQLEDGSGIYYMPAQDFLRKLGIFYSRLIAMSKMAIRDIQHILSTSRLAQRHSITADLWLHWIQNTGDLRSEIKELKRELFSTHDIEARKELERQINELEAVLSSPFMEDIRDWYDIRPSEVDELLNANSVLLFRDDGTLINPLIVDWVDFSFTSNIDESFIFRGKTVAPHTQCLWGTTLHPIHPMIHGTIEGNEYVLEDGQEFIPKLHMAFVGATQEACGILVKSLTVSNEVLKYVDVQRVIDHEPILVEDATLRTYARKFLTKTQQQSATTTGIVLWKTLNIRDFVYVNVDGGMVFNAQSLLKIPDAWVTEDEANRKYVFDRNAWSSEKISIVSYSPYDFSYRIWIERLNEQVQCTFTAYNTQSLPSLPLKDSNLKTVKETSKVELVHVEESGWNGPSKEVYASTKTWTLAFKDESRLSSWFNIELPEVVDNDRILCFVNGLLQPKSRIDGNVISVDTVMDNSSIAYSSEKVEFGELSLEDWAYELDEDGHHVLIDPNGSVASVSNWKRKKNADGQEYTEPVMVSITESDSIQFQETTLQDWLILDEAISKEKIANFTLEGILYNIVGCSIDKALSYAEIYVLAPIEASRKLRYSWSGWKLSSVRNEYGVVPFNPEIDAVGDIVDIWPFTYDNARLFPFAPHNELITSIKDAEVWPDKQKDNPNIHWVVEYRHIGKLLNGFKHRLVVLATIASQKQSETVDRILATWWDSSSNRVHQDFLKNASWLASANYSSTLLFGEDGLLVDPRTIAEGGSGFDWSNVKGLGEQTVGLPQKWWTRPLQAETPVEIGRISGKSMTPITPVINPHGRVGMADGKLDVMDVDIPDEKLVFVDGFKILASRVSKADGQYKFLDNFNGKDALAFSMGPDWIMQNGSNIGYFNIVKNGNSWNISTRRNDAYSVVDTLEVLDGGIDVGEFVGLSMGRSIGTIWDASESSNIFHTPGAHSLNEIRGTTEMTSVVGDKKRFVDLSFLSMVDILEEGSNTQYKSHRLYVVKNSDRFGVVEKIVNVDPNFFMVFIDGKHSPIELRQWRYLKGTFFLEVEPSSSVEVYIGNPYSYLRPDFAKCCTTSIGELAFNNLRVNMVPKHHEELIDWKMLFIDLMAFQKHEIEWRRICKTGIVGYHRENWIRDVHAVQKASETFDDILYWKQMRPNAWLDVEDPMKLTNASSMLVFDSAGGLIDNIRIDWHRRMMAPYGSGHTVEIMRPEDILYTGQIYFPAWEYDETEGHILHTALYTLDDGSTEGRYKELVESNWNTVYIDNVAYNYDQWFSKQFADLHLEESAFVNEYPELSQGENLKLIDELLDGVQNEEALRGTLRSFQIEAVRQSVRSMVVGSQNMDLVVEVPSILGAMVFVDGVKLPDNSVVKRIVRNGRQYRQGINLGESDIPTSGEVKQYIVLDGSIYGDSMEHIVHVYWPAPEYGSSITQGNLCNLLYSNSDDVFWEGIWRGVSTETYFKPEMKESLERLLQHSGFMGIVNGWLATENGKAFKTSFGLPNSPNASQLADAIVQYAPRAIPEFVRGVKDLLPANELVNTYKLFASFIRIDPPLIEQFREYVKSRFLLFIDGRQVQVSVDGSGRIVVLPDIYSSIKDALSRINMFEDVDFAWKVLGEGESLADLPQVAIEVHPTNDRWEAISGETTYLVPLNFAEAAFNGTLEPEVKFIPLENGLQVRLEINEYGRLMASCPNVEVLAEDCTPLSFELYCIDLSNPILRSSTTVSDEDYQSLHFQNYRVFQFVEVDTRINDFKMMDWKVQYFIRETDFRTDITIYMNRIGWMHSNSIVATSKATLISETIDEVLARQQMDPSAWAGLDFNILSKSSKSSLIVFDGEGNLVDPFNINFEDGTINPWTSGKTVEILTPEETVRMSKIYWPIYAVDPAAHSEPYSNTDRRFKELRESDFEVACVDGTTFDIDLHFGKEVQDVHEEESAWIYPRAGTEFELGRYEAYLENAGWDAVRIVDLDIEHLFLTDSIMTGEGKTATGNVVGVAIDADTPMVRDVQTVLANGRFIVPVPRLDGELVFVDGIKLVEGSYKKVIVANGNISEWNGTDIPSNVQMAIEIVDPILKDDDEHVTTIYWPNSNWAERIASPANLKNAILGHVQSDWRELGFHTFKSYLQSRFVLFCNGRLAMLSCNELNETFIDGVALDAYECNSFELYIVDISNENCRTSESPFLSTEASFVLDNRQKNIFMETHRENSFNVVQWLQLDGFKAKDLVLFSPRIMPMSTMKKLGGLELSGIQVEANNADTFDNVFCNGSVPVRSFVNPSLFVEKISKVNILGIEEYEWKVLSAGENIEDLEFVAIDVHPIDDHWDPIDGSITQLVTPHALETEYIVDDRIYFKLDYVPTDWNFQLYATSRENPEWFLPCERIQTKLWMFYKGWNQRLLLSFVDFSKSVYVLETFDVSMEGTITNTDCVYWLEKEFNKKSTLILDNYGLLEHPEGLDWKDMLHIFPHEGIWTAQAEEAEFPAVINELIPDNIQKRLIMDLCLDDAVGYDNGINQVADACIDSIVATNPRVYRTSKWEVLANKDYIYWEQGEFRNWIAWLRDDDVFDQLHCFVFVNGFKIPDDAWTYDADANTIKIPLEQYHLISRLSFIKKRDIYNEEIYLDNVQAKLIDEEEIVVQELEEDADVIVDANWAIWKDKDGLPVWGDPADVKDDWQVVVTMPDPREGIIWPISRIWRKWTSCTSAGIDVPEYLGYDLRKYVMAWVDGRHVQCDIDGTRIFVPGCETAHTVEVYVFELHDGAWVDRFNAIPDTYNLLSFRDLRVC